MREILKNQNLTQAKEKQTNHLAYAKKNENPSNLSKEIEKMDLTDVKPLKAEVTQTKEMKNSSNQKKNEKRT